MAEDKLVSEHQALTVMIVLVVVVAVVIGGLFWWLHEQPSTAPLTQAPVNEPPAVAPEVLVADYQSAARRLFQSYLAQKAAAPLQPEISAEASAAWSTLATQSQDELLELRLPAEFKGLHLQLVLSFNQLEIGLADQDWTAVAAAEEKLDQLAVDYPWLLEK